MTLTVLDKFEASRKTGKKVQERINEFGKLLKKKADGDRLIALILTAAEASHSDYPQYEDHWEGWALVKFLSSVTTKAGGVFEGGDFALLKSERPSLDKKVRYTAFSVRCWIDVSVVSTCYSMILFSDNP